MAALSPPSGKKDFAKRAIGFAEAALPGFPTLWLVSGAGCVLMIVTGGFGTVGMPLGQRIGFWLLLIGWNLAKWQLWFAWRVRKPQDWWRAALTGSVVVNLPLPIEIWAALRLMGFESSIMPGRTWIQALAIGGVIFAVIAALRWPLSPPTVAAAPAPEGPLARARVAPERLAAIEAEDHYCRMRLTDGTSVLVHARFADALADVAGLDGAQTHRGAWVAAAAVTGAARQGRRWLLVLGDGSKVPVSARHAGAVRARGWLRC
jgi:hypothetical protein